MPYSRYKHRFPLLLLLIFSFIKLLVALKCRSDEWLSNAEMKRVTRSCMRRISESAGQYNSNQNNGMAYYNHGQQPSQHYRSQQLPDSNHYYYNNDYEYDNADTDERDNNFRHKFNQQTSNYERTDDILRQRNRERDRDRGSRTTKSPGQNYRGKYDRNRGNASQSQLEYNRSNGNRNIAIGDNHNGNSTYDASCVALCFFGELNMVNGDGYPDKYKVKYLLTKDLHDHELRDFYMETIQECFLYLERYRKWDKCHYSRGLVNCMIEYAKANCEDWNDYSMIFN